MSRAFVVLGAESTGTRLATEILLANGCVGDAGHFQPFDRGPIVGDPVAWRRSVPHSGQPLDLSRLLARLEGYDVTAVVTVRDWTAAARSQVACRLAESPGAAYGKLADAYCAILGQVAAAPLPYTMVSYESLVLHPAAAQAALLSRLGLGLAEVHPVYDGNAARLNEEAAA